MPRTVSASGPSLLLLLLLSAWYHRG